MNKGIEQKVRLLRTDFESAVGHPFEHFYCPILFRDESVSLCQAHVVNEAFSGSAKIWTVQREDVDNFFGSRFESEFVLLQERGKHTLEEILADKTLSKKLKPKIVVGEQEVPYYRPTGPVPEHHTELFLEVEGRPKIPFALKLSQNEALATLEQGWGIKFDPDVRLAALVSLLKAAHLTMFALLGYVYALSAGGYFLGSNILGKFFLANRGKRKPAVLDYAKEYFSEFQNLVRPFAVAPPGLDGTISDGMLYLCTDGSKPWGFIVLVRTGADMHGVLIPMIEDDTSAARYFSFLHAPPREFQAKLTKFAGDHWEISPNYQTVNWPEANFEDSISS